MSFAKVKLGQIANIYVGLPVTSSDATDSGRLDHVLTVRALTGRDIDTDYLVPINLEGRDVNHCRVRPGDILLSSRSTQLKTAVVSEKLAGLVINATLLGVRCQPELEPRLLVAYLNHPEGQAALESVSQSATHQMNITASGMSKLEIPLPPVDVQRQLVQILEQADCAYDAAIQAAEKRRKIAQEVILRHMKNGSEQ